MNRHRINVDSMLIQRRVPARMKVSGLQAN